MKNPGARAFVFVLMITFAGVMCSQMGGEPSAEREATSQGAIQRAQVDQAIQGLVDDGFIKKADREMHEVYVDPTFWAMMNIDQKETVARSLATWADPAAPYIDIYDYQSGKKLADVGAFGGFDVYP